MYLPSKSTVGKKEKNVEKKKVIFLASCQPLTKKQDPDPFVSGTDTQHWF
jgi:hypothetical protein